MELLECGVCCNSKENDRHNFILCSKCQYVVCSQCVKTYLLNITSDSHCMNCSHTWDVLFLKKNLDPTFLDGEYKNHRKQILLKRFNRSRNNNYLCPCPSCHLGKILKTTFTCSSCWVKVCTKCHGHLGNNHECQKNIVLSLEKINETTKQCPGCHVSIEKRSGCYQMFCTHCYTAFDWNNGSIIENDTIHNPHYFDHQNNISMTSSFLQKIHTLQEYSFKWVYKEFYNLMMDIARQITQNLHALGEMERKEKCGSFVENDLLEMDEARRQYTCQYVLWMSYYKRGLELVRNIIASIDKKDQEIFVSKIRCFKDDLKEILIDFNEHVAGCLQLRGYRLFPCNPPLICVS